MSGLVELGRCQCKSQGLGKWVNIGVRAGGNGSMFDVGVRACVFSPALTSMSTHVDINVRAGGIGSMSMSM